MSGGTFMPGSEVIDWLTVGASTGAFLLAGLILIDETRRIQNKPRVKAPIDNQERKRRAKRENERIKLTATFLNGTGIAVLLAITIMPIFRSLGPAHEPMSWTGTLVGVALAIGFHISGLMVLSLWRSEE